MDSSNYPLIDLFCEDDIAKKILERALQEINRLGLPGMHSRLVNIVVSGSAAKTFTNFIVRERTYNSVKIKSGHSCVLDGDMRGLRDKNQSLLYPAQKGLFFLPGTVNPEKLLCDLYERKNPNPQLRYHVDNSNPHCLFQKMVEFGESVSIDAAFDMAWQCLIDEPSLRAQFEQLAAFIIDECRRYSPDL
jgi:hypothetical protein